MNDQTATQMTEDTKPLTEQSPSEKLSDPATVASDVPGAQNPASTEIKREVNLNTE